MGHGRSAGTGGPAGTRGLMPTMEVDLALSPLYVNKVLFHPVFNYVVFLGDSYIKMQ